MKIKKKYIGMLLCMMLFLTAISVTVPSLSYRSQGNIRVASLLQANNTAPVFGTPTPLNGSTNVPVDLIWSIPINDSQGDRFNWTIQCSNGQMNSGGNASNGTKTLPLSHLSYLTMYKIWVNATDPLGSGNTTRSWFIFTTLKANQPPIFGAPSPTNGSLNNPLNFTWSFPISDPNGDPFDYLIHCSNGQSKIRVNMSNGTKTLALTNLSFSTTYTVWVNATDPNGSGLYTRAWFVFTTMTENQPPVFGAPSPANGSINNPLNFTWSIPISDPNGDRFDYLIHCSNGQSKIRVNMSNGTKTLALTNLSFSTKYTVWVNATDPNGSGLYTRAWFVFTTKTENQPPTFGTPTPANNSMNTPLNLTWSIPISDPNGDRFNYMIHCSNGQTTAQMNVSNGTKSLQLTNLMPSTTYKIWVNATDPNGSGLYTRRWYIFTTQSVNQTTISIAASPHILWPPNHKMRDVLITGSVTGMTPGMTLSFTVADEYHLIEPPLTGFGQTIHLQAWRIGQDKDGRIYTITATVTNAQGIVATASTTVLVPHDQGD